MFHFKLISVLVARSERWKLFGFAAAFLFVERVGRWKRAAGVRTVLLLLTKWHELCNQQKVQMQQTLLGFTLRRAGSSHTHTTSVTHRQTSSDNNLKACNLSSVVFYEIWAAPSIRTSCLLTETLITSSSLCMDILKHPVEPPSVFDQNIHPNKRKYWTRSGFRKRNTSQQKGKLFGATDWVSD